MEHLFALKQAYELYQFHHKQMVECDQRIEAELAKLPNRANNKSFKPKPRKGGRKPKLTPKQILHARKLLEDRTSTSKDVAATFGVNRATIYRALGLGAAGERARPG